MARDSGAIVRIRIRNFMTYCDTELEPGPNLNMILGPNGTGKSAIVCCIIVGLAGEVALTGRGGSPADFVKKDTNSGSTEIELFNNKGPNYVIQRKIIIENRTQYKIDHKSEWKINGKAVLKSDVQNLTKKLNIKVDNLCQFLPQDSVTQFVKMNTYELLINTLKAAGDNQLVEDHQKLIELTNEYEDKVKNLEHLNRACKENEVNAKRLESEVHQLRERESLVKQRNICGQKIHYTAYNLAKAKYEDAKKECDKIKEDLKNIEKNSEPFRRAVELYNSELAKYRDSTVKSDTEIREFSRRIQDTQNEIENLKISCQEEFSKFRSKQEQENERESTIRLKNQELENLECKLVGIKDVDCSKKLHEVQNAILEKKNERVKCNRDKNRLDEELRNRINEIETLKRECDQIQSVRSKKDNLLRVRSPQTYKVLEWLAKNKHKFKDTVFSPIMCEINVKDAKFNRIVENAIPRQELLSFVCQNEADLRLFTRSVRDELNLKFNVILAPDKGQNFDNQSSQHNLAQYGVKAHLKDLIDAPEPILQYLCASNNFHRIPVAESCSETQLKQLLQICPRFYVGNQVYSVSKSRYDNQSMTVSESIREAQLLQFSLDTKRLAEATQRLNRSQELRDEANLKREELYRYDDELKSSWQTLVETHRELKSKHEEKNRLEVLINRVKEAIVSLKTEKINIDEERKKLEKSVEKISQKSLNKLETLTDIYKNLIELKEIHMANLLLAKLARRNHKLAQKKCSDAVQDTSRLNDAIVEKQRASKILKLNQVEAEKLAEERIPGFEDGKIDKVTKRKFDSIQETTLEELKNKKDELTVRIQRIYKDANNTIMTEFNRQNEELREKRSLIGELESSIQFIDNSREEIKKSWVPKLQDVIEVIDKNYREFMQKLSYDGQVKLDFNETKPNDFSSYGIMILVKYRDNEQLIPLSSTRQSGGERSVATMIYMLALQTKTTVPFRCVDEINQGMDKENERKVFELLVKTADSSSSQYFLVSPKLLSNLPYSEKMKIHVVFNGKRLDLAWNKVKET